MDRDNEELETVELGVASELTEGGLPGSPEIGGRLKVTGIGDDD